MLIMPTSLPFSTTGVPDNRLSRRMTLNSAMVWSGLTLTIFDAITSPTRSS